MPSDSHLSSSPEAASYRRAVAAPFTQRIPKHHPFFDPDLRAEDVALVPRDLVPKGGLSWELPKTMTATMAERGRKKKYGVGRFREGMGGMKADGAVGEVKMSSAALKEEVFWDPKETDGRDSMQRFADAFDDHDCESKLRSDAHRNCTVAMLSPVGTYAPDIVPAPTPKNRNELREVSGSSDGSHNVSLRPQVARRLASAETEEECGIASHLRISEWVDAVVTSGPFLGRSDDQLNMSECARAGWESLAEYDCLWSSNDTYGRKGKRPLPELRRRAGTLRLRTEN